ncbi:conserved hypothetical protein [Pediculus humanus corporis]|uniref:Protein SYS1 homolog n=1 Tax=Pediculus humanus subsp. corporis TaxID=121224 RepID=E0VH92_PEDHC|nr:uncharacterized protein Phum_PHUM204080 [Pediculus humanus corporis]EEB12748.1 conserved hypothetical protein [Pediculus humanus corporis]
MKKYCGQFRNSTWDPILIMSQIVALQALFYLSLGAIVFLMDCLLGSSRSLDHLFKYQEIHVRDLGGKLIIAGFIINALFGAFGLWFIVERTKQCLDFSSTAHLIHLIACWNYNSSFPNTLSWWLLNLACLGIMCISGEFLCLRSELRAIPINFTPKVDL